VRGNHDVDALSLPWARRPEFLAEISVDGTRIVMCHYALRVWPRQHHGAIHLFGHSHGKVPGTPTSLDVGVDCWGFTPVSLSNIRGQLAAAAAQTAT
jgi:calcineurin-like phosphoesterase family protein